MRIRQKYKTLRFLFGTAPSLENSFPPTDTFAREEYDQQTRLICFMEMYLSEMKRLTGELVSLHDQLYSIMHGNYLNTRCFADLPHMELSWIQRVLLALKSEVDKLNKSELCALKDSFMQCDIKLKRLDMCGEEKERYETKVGKLKTQLEKQHMKCNNDKKLLRNIDKLQTAKDDYESALINSRSALEEITNGERQRFAAFVCNAIRSIVRGLNIPALLAEETEDVTWALKKCRFPSRHDSPHRLSPPFIVHRTVPPIPRGGLASPVPVMYEFEEKKSTIPSLRPHSLSTEFNNIESDGKHLGLLPPPPPHQHNGSLPLDHSSSRSIFEVPHIDIDIDESLLSKKCKNQEEETAQRAHHTQHAHQRTTLDTKNNDRAREEDSITAAGFSMDESHFGLNGIPHNAVSFRLEKNSPLEMDESDAIVGPRPQSDSNAHEGKEEKERANSHSHSVFFPPQSPSLWKSAVTGDVRRTQPPPPILRSTSSMPRVGTAETMAPSADSFSSLSSSPHDGHYRGINMHDPTSKSDDENEAICKGQSQDVATPGEAKAKNNDEHLGRTNTPLHLYFPPSPQDDDEEEEERGRRRKPRNRRRRWSNWGRSLKEEDLTDMSLGGGGQPQQQQPQQQQQSREEVEEERRRRRSESTASTTSERGRLKAISRTRERISLSWGRRFRHR